MSRITKVSAVIVSTLVTALATQNALAGTITTAGFTSTAGLDLTGNFIQAVNNGGAAVANVGGLDFTGNAFFLGNGQSGAADAGFSEATLNYVMRTFGYFNPATSISGSIPVTINNSYKLQLLFWEPDPDFQTAGRDFTITLESDVLNNFNAVTVAGGGGAVGKGAVVTYEYLAADSNLDITIASSQFGIINGFTLELLPAPEPSAALLMLIGSCFVVRVRRKK